MPSLKPKAPASALLRSFIPKKIARIAVALKSTPETIWPCGSLPSPSHKRAITIQRTTTRVISRPYLSAIFMGNLPQVLFDETSSQTSVIRTAWFEICRSVLISVFSVRPLCSLWLRGEFCLGIAHHKDTENTKDTQRRFQTKTSPGPVVTLSNAFHVSRFAMDGHIEPLKLTCFVDFHRRDPIDNPEHAVSKDERPKRGEQHRTELDQEEMRIAAQQAIR